MKKRKTFSSVVFCLFVSFCLLLSSATLAWSIDGYCCRDGVISSSSYEQCAESGGRFYGTRRLADSAGCESAGESAPVGWCCVNGSVRRQNSSDCERSSGRFFDSREDANDYCESQEKGWCCDDGEISKLTKTKCQRNGGRFFDNRGAANNYCESRSKGWCCDNGELFEVIRRDCKRVRGRFFDKRGAASHYCESQNRGWCCDDGEIFEKTERECQRANGRFFDNKRAAKHYCESQNRGWCCVKGKLIPSAFEECSRKKGRFFENRRVGQSECDLAPLVRSLNPDTLIKGETNTLVLTGENLREDMNLDFGPDIVVQSIREFGLQKKVKVILHVMPEAEEMKRDVILRYSKWKKKVAQVSVIAKPSLHVDPKEGAVRTVDIPIVEWFMDFGGVATGAVGSGKFGFKFQFKWKDGDGDLCDGQWFMSYDNGSMNGNFRDLASSGCPPKGFPKTSYPGTDGVADDFVYLKGKDQETVKLFFVVQDGAGHTSNTVERDITLVELGKSSSSSSAMQGGENSSQAMRSAKETPQKQDSNQLSVYPGHGQLVAFPDLIPTKIWADQSTCHLWVEWENQGGAVPEKTFVERFWLTGSFRHGSNILTSHTFDSSNKYAIPASSKENHEVVDLYDIVILGKTKVKYKIDGTNAHLESNENNNILEQTVTCNPKTLFQPKKDLTLQKITDTSPSGKSTEAKQERLVGEKVLPRVDDFGKGKPKTGNEKNQSPLKQPGLIPDIDSNRSGNDFGDGIAGETGDDKQTIPHAKDEFGDGKEADKLLNNMDGGESQGPMNNLYGPVRPDIGAGSRADGGIPTAYQLGGWKKAGNWYHNKSVNTKGDESEMWGVLSRGTDVVRMGGGKKVKVTFDPVTGVSKVQIEGSNVVFVRYSDGTVVKTGQDNSGKTVDGSEGDSSGKNPIPMSVRLKIKDGGVTAAANEPPVEPAVSGGNPVDPIEQSANTQGGGAGSERSQKQQQKEEKAFIGKTPGFGHIGPADPNLPGGRGNDKLVVTPKGLHVVDPIHSKGSTLESSSESRLAMKHMDAHEIRSMKGATLLPNQTILKAGTPFANLVCSVKGGSGIIISDGKSITLMVGNKGIAPVFGNEYKVGIKPASTNSKTIWSQTTGVKLTSGEQKDIKLPWPPPIMEKKQDKSSTVPGLPKTIFDDKNQKQQPVPSKYIGIIDFENKIMEGAEGEKDNICGPFEVAIVNILEPVPPIVTESFDGDFNIKAASTFYADKTSGKIKVAQILVDVDSKNSFSIGDFTNNKYGAAWLDFEIYNKVWLPTGGGKGTVALKKVNGGIYSVSGKDSNGKLNGFNTNKAYSKGKHTVKLTFEPKPQPALKGVHWTKDMPSDWLGAGNVCQKKYFPVVRFVLNMQTKNGVKSKAFKVKKLDAPMTKAHPPGEVNMCSGSDSLDSKIP